MATCEIAIPIRSAESFPVQAPVATCMRCGERYVSRARDGGMIEQTCGCGVAYRVEALTIEFDVVASWYEAVPAANEHYFREPVLLS